MRNFPKKSIHRSSSTNWEDSFYGGYVKTLYDMPDVVAPDNIQIRISAKGALGFYLGQKIVKIFLFKAAQHNVSHNLLFDSRIHEMDGVIKGKSMGRYLLAKPEAISKAFEMLCTHETELRNLFRYYEKDILGSTIMFKIDNGKGNPLDAAKEAMSEMRVESTDVSREKLEENSLQTNAILEGPFNTVFKLVAPGKETIYTADEQICIKRLAQRLDISFDSDKDVVRSLKQGKVDTHKLAEIVAFNDRIYSRVLEDQKTKPFRVVVLCDESGSMKKNGKIHFQYKLVKIIFGALSSIMPMDQIYVYGHTGDEQPEIFTYHDPYNPNFNTTIGQMLERENGENYDGPVIQKIHEKIRSFTDAPILMIVISDGEPHGYNYGSTQSIRNLKRIIEKCKRDNFVILGIGFGYGGVKDIYGYHTIVRNIPDVVEATTVLLNKVIKTEFK